MVLSDLGAEVIKIENIGGEETRKAAPVVNGQSIYFGVYNRGKKSVCINMRSDEGKEIFRDLLRSADFVLENFRPGTMAKMGLDYAALCEVKPDIILLSASAFGQYGPYKDRVGYDGIGQAMSGLMSLTGQTVGRPIGTAFSLVDRTTALHLTIGALAALRHRDQTGEGQVIDVCLMDSALTMVEVPTSYYLATGEQGGEAGRIPYEAKDGWVIVAPNNAKMSAGLNAVIAEGDGSDPSLAPPFPFAGRSERIAEWCLGLTVDDIVDKCTAAEVVVAPVRTIPQVAADPHLWEREMLVKMEDPVAGEMYLPGLSIKFSKTPGKLAPIPTPGQHTDEILTQVAGYDEQRVADLRSAGVI
jgi:crotonobetainyl-CoA:carnitine CoA-transferase CaiB-like acyl-CoA transferase